MFQVAIVNGMEKPRMRNGRKAIASPGARRQAHRP
jgi:hypothetical protein